MARFPRPMDCRLNCLWFAHNWRNTGISLPARSFCLNERFLPNRTNRRPWRGAPPFAWCRQTTPARSGTAKTSHAWRANCWAPAVLRTSLPQRASCAPLTSACMRRARAIPGCDGPSGCGSTRCSPTWRSGSAMRARRSPTTVRRSLWAKSTSICLRPTPNSSSTSGGRPKRQPCCAAGNAPMSCYCSLRAPLAPWAIPRVPHSRRPCKGATRRQRCAANACTRRTRRVFVWSSWQTREARSSSPCRTGQSSSTRRLMPAS